MDLILWKGCLSYNANEENVVKFSSSHKNVMELLNFNSNSKNRANANEAASIGSFAIQLVKPSENLKNSEVIFSVFHLIIIT